MSVAAKHPRSQVLGIEYKGKRIAKLIPRIGRLGLKNIILIEGRAERVLSDSFPKGSIARIFINFPDPWPKRRHAARRLLQPEFMKLLLDRLKDRGRGTIVTDHPDYFAEILAAVRATGGRPRWRESPPEDPIYPEYASSLYEINKRAAGHSIFKLTMVKSRKN